MAKLTINKRTVRQVIHCVAGLLLLTAMAATQQAPYNKTRVTASTMMNDFKHSDRYATRSGRIIKLHPSDVTFQIPDQWLQIDIDFRLTRAELSKVQKHDPFYSVADSVFAFRDCAAQIELYNGSPWVRAYVVDLARDQVLRRIQSNGPRAARKIPGFIPGHTRGFQVPPAAEGLWQHIDVPYFIDEGDVGEGGAVSFFVRPLPLGQLVIVVGSRGNERNGRTLSEARDLLASVTVP